MIEEMSPFEIYEKQRLLLSQESLIASLPPEPPGNMPPELYASDRRQFYRERDRLRAELGMSPSAPDPLLKKRKPKAGAGR